MTYVRIDTPTQYIYFENDTQVSFWVNVLDRHGKLQSRLTQETRSKYTLNTLYKCIRMTRKNNIPIDKKTCVWYNKCRK